MSFHLPGTQVDNLEQARGYVVSGQHARARETAASAAQYVLLGGFAAVAAGISAQGLRPRPHRPTSW
ncbi:MAG: hypothetical protein ABSB59_31305 [Streptosporangiaceae bacterium]|jgi:hypothetical protein